MADNNGEVLEASGYQSAKEEYFVAENTFCAAHLRGNKMLEKVVLHYLLNTERLSPQVEPKQAAREVQLNQVETYEISDYLFRTLSDEDGRPLADRFLDEVGPKLPESTRQLAVLRRKISPSLWQVTDVTEDPSYVLIKNLLDDRVQRLLTGPPDGNFRRLHALLFGDLVEMDGGLVPVGIVYMSQPGDRGLLLAAMERSLVQARAAGLLDSWEEFLRVYEPAIRGAIRVFNGFRPSGASETYLPALGRADLGGRMAEWMGRPFKLPATFKWPVPHIHFGGSKGLAAGVETIHRYFLSDPGAWAKVLSENAMFQLYRLEDAFGWWYGGDSIPFFSERLQTEAEARPILADLRFENNTQMTARVFSPRVFKTVEPILRGMAPRGQVLPKAIAEIQPLGPRLPIYQTHPECRGYMVQAPKLGRRLTPEETALVDEEWLIIMIRQSHHRWAGGRTLDQVLAMDETQAIEDFLNQIEYMAANTSYYAGVVSALRQQYLA